MPLTPVVRFLNVDLIVTGAFDQNLLKRGFGNAAFVLFEQGVHDDEPAMAFEVSEVGLDLEGTLREFLRLIRALSPAARCEWRRASKRIFDCGFDAGKQPFYSRWAVPSDLVDAIAEVGGELVLSIYGAEQGRAPKARVRKKATRPATTTRRARR